MKKISLCSLSLCLRSCLLWIWIICVNCPSPARAGDLAEEWGWFPERAGIIAAESWGIKPQWQGRTLMESYQLQREAPSALVMVRSLTEDPELLPDLPPPVIDPAIPAGFCEIMGEVSDEKLEPVKGAVVEIVGTGKTAETNDQGVFSFAAVASGNLTLEAFKLGYTSDTQSATALPGQKLTMRMMLKVKAADAGSEETTLDEEVVVGEYEENNAGDFNLNINMEAPKLTATMGREEFQKNAVSDAGEAISKVSGANIVDGKYAVVRGLADRYVTTTFNGAQIASADPSRKAIQLDLFPTSAIESIKVDKTYSTNLVGDFGGGAIDIISRALPQERFLQVSSRIGYNDGLKSKTYIHPNRELGALGDIGNELPAVLERRNPDGSITFLDSANTSPEQLADRWRELGADQNLRPKESDSNLSYSQSLAYGETFELANGMKFGLMTAFGRSTGDTYNTTPVTNQVRSFVRDEYSRSAEWTAYIAAALEMNEFNRFQATYFNKHLAQDDISNTRNIIDDTENLNYGIHIPNSDANPQNLYGPDYIYYGAAWDINPLERDLQIYQVKGNHRTHDRGIKMDWAITQSNAIESRPHSTHFEYGVLDFSSKALANQIAGANLVLNGYATQLAQELGLSNPQSYTWEKIRQPLIDFGLGDLYNSTEQSVAIKPDDTRPPVITSDHGASGSIPGKQLITRRTEKSLEDASHSQFSFGIPIYFNDHDDERYVEIGAGAASLTKERETSARAYRLVLSSSSSEEPGFTDNALAGPGGLGELIANDPSLIDDYFNGSAKGNPYYINDLTRLGLENINTSLNQTAYFYNVLLRMNDSFVNAGLRFEKETYDIDIKPSPLSAFSPDQIEGNGWENREPQEAILPAINAGTTIFDERLGFQVGWSQTVARPTFWEFIPSQTIDQTAGLGRRGNNNLGQTEIDNFDLALTFKPADAATIRASLFHKNLVRPLVTFFENGSLLYADSFRDSETNSTQDFTGSLNGIELEGELDDIGPFSIKANFTYIDAQLNYFYVLNGQTTSVTSQLPYQPSYLGNLNLGYEYEPWNFNVNFVYNYNGSYPVILKLTPEDFEVARDEIHTFDLILSKLIETDFVNYTMRLGVKNIFEAVDTYMFNSQVYDSTNIGRNYWAEIQMSF